MNEDHIKALMHVASVARESAYAPYSKYKVGAAVLTGSNKVYFGCNVENASYGLTMCAERVAIQKAVSEGESVVKAVAIVAGEDEIGRPCGACLQVISEFSPKDAPVLIIASSANGEYDVHTLDEYLPLRFKLLE